MENYLIVSQKFEFSNKKLNSSMNVILDEYKRLQKGSENVAKALTNIKDNELQRDDFETFDDCIAIFGIGRAQAYRVIASYKLKYNEEHDGRLDEYTLSQVAEIGRLSISLFCDVIDRGEITPTMSCKDIRDVVDSYKKTDEVDDTPTDDVVGEETPDEENDGIIVEFNGKELPLTDKDTADLEKWLTKRGYI